MSELVKWLNENDKGDDGNWTYSYRFAELMVARDMGLLPSSKWDNLSLADKEEAFTLWKNQKEMQRWEQYLQRAELEKSQRNKGKKYGKFGR